MIRSNSDFRTYIQFFFELAVFTVHRDPPGNDHAERKDPEHAAQLPDIDGTAQYKLGSDPDSKKANQDKNKSLRSFQVNLLITDFEF